MENKFLHKNRKKVLGIPIRKTSETSKCVTSEIKGSQFSDHEQ